MSRPEILVGVVGTATGVGKTWVTARLIEQLKESGISTSARKPAQSYAADDPEPTDAHVLGHASQEEPEEVCPPHRWYPVAMAPPMAADTLGLAAPTLSQLIDELSWPTPRAKVGFLETVGGVRSPVADDGDSRDLLWRVEPDLVLLVADAGLGVIDAVRLAVDALLPLKPLVFLNRFTADNPLHQRNLNWLTRRDEISAEVDLDSLEREISKPPIL